MKDLFSEEGAEKASHFLLIALGGGILILAFLSLWQRNQMVRIGYEIGRLQVQKKELVRIRKELFAEAETLSAMDRIEQIAMEQLGMKVPRPQQRVYVDRERVNTARIEVMRSIR
ncbi:MAG: cell division protein FtsL [Nitrospira sp.]|nr:cell division protein FtsL [Candidatus Manganitrophaceae bacterium]HIL33814.1 cell division protein FtsL [Candidatus Manganitrophaceae bacterium]